LIRKCATLLCEAGKGFSSGLFFCSRCWRGAFFLLPFFSWFFFFPLERDHPSAPSRQPSPFRQHFACRLNWLPLSPRLDFLESGGVRGGRFTEPVFLRFFFFLLHVTFFLRPLLSLFPLPPGFLSLSLFPPWLCCFLFSPSRTRPCFPALVINGAPGHVFFRPPRSFSPPPSREPA